MPENVGPAALRDVRQRRSRRVTIGAYLSAK